MSFDMNKNLLKFHGIGSVITCIYFLFLFFLNPRTF